MISRRSFLAGTTAALACGHVHGQPAPRPHPMRPIDCHFHIMPPEYRRLVGDARADRRMDTWTPQGSIEAMDRGGAQMVISSMTTPGLWFDDVAESRAMVRAANDYAKQLEGDFPGRYQTFASIALPDIEGSLQEIERMAGLGVAGFGVFTSYKVAGAIKWLGHPSFEPIIAELNRRRAIVRTHPDSPCCAGFLMHHGIVDANLEYGVDTNRAIVNMIASGWLTRYPDIKWIWGHGGGTIIPYIKRLIRLPQTYPHVRDNAAQGFVAELQKMYYDTGQIDHEVPLRALADIVSVERILYGSDYPYRSLEDHNNAVGATFERSDVQRIVRSNILRLLQ